MKLPTRRPLPTGLLTLSQKSRLCADHGLDELADFERVHVPTDQLPDTLRASVHRFAAKRGGPIPTTATVFRVRADLLRAQAEPSLFPPS